MLIIDIGAGDGQDFALPYALDERNLVYAIESLPELVRSIQAHRKPNLHTFCLTIEESQATSQNLAEGCHPAIGSAWPTHTSQAHPCELEVTDLQLRTKSTSMGLKAFMEQNAIAEVDLLRINVSCSYLGIIKSAEDLIHNIKRIQLVLKAPSSELEETPIKNAIAFLELSGFKCLHHNLGRDVEEIKLDFERISRFVNNKNSPEHFEVFIPHVGRVSTPHRDLVGQLLQRHLFEGPEQAFLWLYLRPGDTFLDCGAHVGVFSCIAAQKLKNQGRIVAFEPNEENLSLYRQNLLNLGCQCFTAFNTGLSNHPGEASFFLGKVGMSAYGTFADGAKDHQQVGQNTTIVQQVTLDQVVANLSINEVALSKLDVEGWEVPVLSGAAESIAMGKFPVWMIEFTEENALAAGSSTQSLAQLVESFGYTLCRFDATQLRLVPEVRRLKYDYANLFAVLDIEQVNQRLLQASPLAKSIAMDIIAAWDQATRLQETEMLLQLCQEKLSTVEQDRADRLVVIHKLSAQLSEYEKFSRIIKILRKLRRYAIRPFERFPG